jgi:ubiquinone/menaquinone biosynthesis C-methylase UbiE
MRGNDFRLLCGFWSVAATRELVDSVVVDPVGRTYDRLAAVYDRRWARYIRATTRETLARLSLRPDECLLDLGCGTGALLRDLAREGGSRRLYGIDLSLGMVARARQALSNTAHLAVGDVGALPWPAGSFDVIVSVSSFHFWADPGQALREVRRLLRPGGRLVLTDWCADYFVCRLYESILRRFDPAHRQIYHKSQCKDFLTAAGLTEVRVESYRSPWPWGMMTATARAA